MAKSATACPICKKPAKRAKSTVGDSAEIHCGELLADEVCYLLAEVAWP